MIKLPDSISRRDWYKGNALGLGGEFFLQFGNGCNTAEEIAKACGQMADALIAEFSQSESQAAATGAQVCECGHERAEHVTGFGEMNCIGRDCNCESFTPQLPATTSCEVTEAASWAMEIMLMINKLTPDIKGKSFDPGWFELRQKLEQGDQQRRDDGLQRIQNVLNLPHTGYMEILSTVQGTSIQTQGKQWVGATLRECLEKFEAAQKSNP